MKKIIFTYPVSVDDELEKLTRLFENGLETLHLRKPEFSLGEMIKYMSEIPNEFHNRIMIHDHYALIGEYNLAGISLNIRTIGQMVTEDQVNKSFIQPLVLTAKGVEVNGNRAGCVSFSAHHFSEIEKLPFRPDYFILGPIFDSISKEGYKSNFHDHKLLSENLNKSAVDIIALGGIDESKIELCENLGFAGYAMLGSIWRPELIIENKS